MDNVSRRWVEGGVGVKLMIGQRVLESGRGRAFGGDGVGRGGVLDVVESLTGEWRL